MASKHMRFDELTTYLERLEGTSGRLKMYSLLGELLGKANTAKIAEIVYLIEARLAPTFAAIQIGMGERLVASAIRKAAGKAEGQVNRLYKKLGDLGLVAEALLPKKRRSSLTVSRVHSTLLEIARTSGSESIEK